MDIIVRLAKQEDLMALYKLNQEFNEVNFTELDGNYLLEKEREIVAIALVNGTASGFACAQFFTSFCYNDPQGEITEMYVQEAYRGNGLAGQMIRCLENELRGRGVESIKILTNKSNEAAIKAYTREGYTLKNEVVLQKKIG